MRAFGITDKGKVRQVNQDSFLFDIRAEEDRGAAVLCDGMGGERAGEVASELAAGAFMENVLKSFVLGDTPLAVDIARESAAWSNLCVFDQAARNTNYAGMGTTLVAVVINGPDAAIVNVGDSRAYWLAEGQLQQVTRDHSWVQDMVEQGVITPGEARSHPRKNLITRAVGHQRRIRSDIFRMDLREGDIMLLCSDGLSNLVTEDEIKKVLLSGQDLSRQCRDLLQMALDRGAPDNVTVLILQR